MFKFIKKLFRRKDKMGEQNINLSEVENIIMWYFASRKYREMKDGNDYYRGKHDILFRQRTAIGENGELTHDDRERAMNSYNAPDSVNQVNWDLINERQESIDFIRQIIRLKTQTSAFSYPTYEEVYRHVFVHTAIQNSGWIVYEIQGTKEHFLVVFNAKGASFYYENAGNLEMLVTNSRSNQENTLDNVSVAVMNVLV